MVASTLKFVCLAAVALAMTASGVEAHGKLSDPAGLNIDPNVAQTSQKDVTRIRGNEAEAPCGRFQNGRGDAVNLADADMTPRMLVRPGAAAQLQWFQQNGDGAGPLTASIDPTGTGRNFQAIEMNKQLPGKNGRNNQNSRKNVPISVNIPKNLECNGPNNSCLLRLQNPLGFVSCAPIGVRQ